MSAWTLTLISHVGLQLHNTYFHLAAGFVLALFLLALGFPLRRAVLLVVVYALLREFAYQLPFRDGWHLKLEDRLLDSIEWGLGALAAPLVSALLSPLWRRVRPVGGRLLSRVFCLVPAASRVANPVVRH